MKKYRRILAKNTVYWMNTRKISKTDLAKKSKISRVQLDKILKCNVSCGLDVIARIAKVVRVQPYILLASTRLHKIIRQFQ